MHITMIVAALGVAVAGCATSPDRIAAAYVSPLTYDAYDCQQITAEAIRVSNRAAELTGQQKRAQTNDAVATGIGVVLFWPALFFIKGKSPQEGELARLKGEMETLQQVSIQKKCGMEFRPAQ